MNSEGFIFSDTNFVFDNNKGWLRKDKVKFRAYIDGRNPRDANLVTHIRPKNLKHISLVSHAPRTAKPLFTEQIPYLRFIDEDSSKIKSVIGYHKMDDRLPIASLILNTSDLFDYAKGIYAKGFASWVDTEKANYKMKGKEWGCSANFLLVNEKNNELTNGEVEIRINGDFSRQFAQKSFRVKLEEKDRILAPNVNFREYVLRNGGNELEPTMIRDALLHELGNEMGLNAQQNKATRLYLNGVYWGIYFFQPRINKEFLINRLGLNSSNDLILIDNHRVKYASDLESSYLAELIKNENWYTFFDIDKSINYFLLQTFYINRDWPGNNELWAKNSSGKWEPIVKDLDGCANIQNASINMFDILLQSDEVSGLLFQRIVTSPNYLEQFNQQYRKLDSLFFDNENQWEKRIDSLQNLLRTEMNYHTLRWRLFTLDEWSFHISNLRNFRAKRRYHFRRQLFQLTEEDES